jgi:UDP-galactopyranose mutase
METKKIIIFGAGISGATIARKFADIGYDVIIYEKKKEIGGNCFDYKNKHGVLVHKFGPHIFHTNSEEVYEFINRFDKLNNFINKVQVSVNNIRFPIPINFKSIEIIFPNDAKYIITTLKKIFQDKKTITLFELEEIQDKKIKLLYNYVYKNVFANYTAKM